MDLWFHKQLNKHLKYFRADIRPTTNTVPHGALSEMADGSSRKEKRATEDSCSSGILKSLLSDKGQPGDVSTASPSSNNGAANDPNETIPFHGGGL